MLEQAFEPVRSATHHAQFMQIKLYIHMCGACHACSSWELGCTQCDCCYWCYTVDTAYAELNFAGMLASALACGHANSASAADVLQIPPNAPLATVGAELLYLSKS